MQQHSIEMTWQEMELHELAEDDQLLIEEAKRAQQYSYCPYSGWPVGAAVQCRDGSVFCGANQENCDFTSTEHAERLACHTAGGSFGKGNQIIKIAIFAPGERLIPPCQGCLAVLKEYEFRSGKRIIILFAASQNKYVGRIIGTEALSPLSFNPKDLQKHTLAPSVSPTSASPPSSIAEPVSARGQKTR